ncbi:MAG: amidase [Caldilineaceae bacterium]|nr:amidase [Caldilineaceae bacterium]
MNERLHEATIADLQIAMTSGELSAQQIALDYFAAIEAIDWAGPQLRSVIELNPHADRIAAERDRERAAGHLRGPLHGIPILLKDNIDTADAMQTTAGSLALLGSKPAEDATLTAKLREAGAVILGKANLSEWANFRSTKSTSGWSARGGQCRNPYLLTHNPCGSSSGSGAAIAANLAAAALGTETDGSIVCPAGRCGIVGLKPTVGLTSRAGVIPISHSQDTVGPMTRTVADAALVLSALTGVDPRDRATALSAEKFAADYSQFLDPNGLRGARIGVARQSFFGVHAETDALIEEVIDAMRRAGAEIVDPADIPHAGSELADKTEFEVLLYEFQADMAAYLSTRQPVREDYPQPRTLADLIEFNVTHAAEELVHFGQEIFELAAAKGPLTDAAYLEAISTSRHLSRAEGIDAVMDQYHLDALVAPTGGPAWPTDYENEAKSTGSSSQPAAMAGYPLITVPVGFIGPLPVGITFMGRAFSEAILIRLAYALEQSIGGRRAPAFLNDW